MPHYAPPPEQAVKDLAHCIDAWCAHPPEDSGPRLVRFETPIAGPNPLDWLQAQPDQTRYYWSDRGGDFEMAGIGEADVLVPLGEVDISKLFAHMRTRLGPDNPSLRYYGGFRFAEREEKCARWKEFKSFRFVVPRMEMLKRDKHTVLACNFAPGNAAHATRLRQKLLETVEALQFPEAAPEPVMPDITGRTDRPSEAEWAELVERALCAMARGELEKVVLARETCFWGNAAFDPIALLRNLLRHTVRSFEFCFHPAPDRAFIGASPERLYKRMNCYVESEALAGTRPRGANAQEDAELEKDLLADEKELAEHIMLVDLGRNDVGRVSRAGTVAPVANKLMVIERYSHVMHIVSEVAGQLDPKHDAFDALAATFPMGTVSGAPKIRAMQIIDELEPERRGPYSGGAGYISYSGDMDTCILIRTMVLKDGMAYLQAGAGIVYDSDPDREYDETVNKAKALVRAIEFAERGLEA